MRELLRTKVGLLWLPPWVQEGFDLCEHVIDAPMQDKPMPEDQLALISLFGLTALNWTIHWYTQMVTYRLFPDIAAKMSGQDFVAYHRAYQGRLVFAIYIPWSLLMIASVAVVLAMGSSLWPWVLLGLNAAIGGLSFALAVPIHARIDRDARLEASDTNGLLRANLARLVAASASLLICTLMMLRFFAA